MNLVNNTCKVWQTFNYLFNECEHQTANVQGTGSWASCARARASADQRRRWVSFYGQKGNYYIECEQVRSASEAPAVVGLFFTLDSIYDRSLHLFYLYLYKGHLEHLF